MNSDTASQTGIGLAEALELAIRAQQHGEIDQAREIYRRILEVWPDCPDAVHFLGLLAYQQGDHEQASALVEKSLVLAPDHPGFWNNLGNLHKEKGNKFEAAAAYRRSIALQPDFADAHNNLGVMASQQGDFAAAVASYQKAISLQSDHADAYLNFGNALEQLGLLADATLAYEARIHLRPNHPEAYGRLGILLWRQGKKEEAVEAIVANTELDPGDTQAFLFLGHILAEQERNLEACEALRKVVEISPRHTGANRMLGLTLARAGKIAESREVWLKWAEADPANPVPRHLVQAGSDEGIPVRANDDFVVCEFDRFANSFDKKLKHLQYQAPELVAGALQKLFPDPTINSLAILDAGCGTGLCGPLVRPLARYLEGVDLSPGMLEKAGERGGYDALIAAELTAFMTSKNEAYEVIISADTLCYFGQLEEVSAAAAGALKPGGFFIFTVEKTSDNAVGKRVTLDPSGRYTHTEAYVRSSITRTGLVVMEISQVFLRMEYFKPVEGLLVVLQKQPPGFPDNSSHEEGHAG